MLLRATKSFSGIVSMGNGEIKDISDKAIVKDLLDAGYVERVEDPAPVKAAKTEKPAAKKAASKKAPAKK